MDEQPRAESAAEEQDPARHEPALPVAPSAPADVPPLAAPHEPPGQRAPATESSEGAWADQRIHPWQVVIPATPEPARLEPMEPGVLDAEEAGREGEGRAEPTAFPFALATEEPFAPDVAAPVFVASADGAAAPEVVEAAPESLPVESVESVESVEPVEPVEIAPVVAEASPAASDAADHEEPLAPADAVEPEAAPQVIARGDVAGAARPSGLGALPLFTAATVPPGPPGPRGDEPRADRRAHDLPAIPVDPSAETVPLSSRTDEVASVARAYPGYPGYAGSPQTAERPGWFAGLRQPLSRDAIVRFLTAACGTIVLAAVLGILLTQGEWATGLAAAGIASLLVASAYLVGTVVRAIAGASKRRLPRLGLLAVVIFGLLGEAGVYFNGSLHQPQAQVLATVGDFGGAVREYRLAGYLPPNPDLARAYVNWGNALLRRRDYADAASSFQVVVEEYASTAVARDAATGLLAAYAGWMASASPAIPYTTVLRDLVVVGQAAYCDSTCRAAATQLTALAHLQYGHALNGRGEYALAIAQFETVTTLYAASPYAPTAHANAAITYYLVGESQLHGKTCTDAVPTFQRLTSAYGDTTEGATAKAALAAPVSVSGSLTGYPKSPSPIVYLSKTIRSDTYFSDDYSATLDGNGSFTFSSVPPGSYNLSAAIPNGSGVYWVDPTTHNPYSITVGPLCTLTLQPYPYS